MRSGSDRRAIAFQIANGLGAGNIGDEFMARAFWQLSEDRFDLQVPLMENAHKQRQPYPPSIRYLDVSHPPEEPSADTEVGLLVGDTPITEVEGLDWPLRFLEPRLRWFHERAIPVDAIAVGVDLLESPEALAIFQSSFLPIRSWSVRSRRCRQALSTMGVNPADISLAADLAWAYLPSGRYSSWAEQTLLRLGVSFDRPIVMVNVLNLVWRDRTAFKDELARALSVIVRQRGVQVVFFCSESRDGADFDAYAAREIMSRMDEQAFVIDNEYFSPDEALALLSFATATVSMRYHFTIATVLAGSIPVTFLRSQKMRSLCDELPWRLELELDTATKDGIVRAVLEALDNGQIYRERIPQLREALATRVRHCVEPGVVGGRRT